jgi:hypothetical protein
MSVVSARPQTASFSPTYQIGQRVQLLPHHAAFLPPARHLAVHEVEEETKREEGQRGPEIAERRRFAEAVAHRREDGHDATEPWH